jgi:hypothetical protein
LRRLKLGIVDHTEFDQSVVTLIAAKPGITRREMCYLLSIKEGKLRDALNRVRHQITWDVVNGNLRYYTLTYHRKHKDPDVKRIIKRVTRIITNLPQLEPMAWVAYQLEKHHTGAMK